MRPPLLSIALLLGLSVGCPHPGLMRPATTAGHQRWRVSGGGTAVGSTDDFLGAYPRLTVAYGISPRWDVGGSVGYPYAGVYVQRLLTDPADPHLVVSIAPEIYAFIAAYPVLSLPLLVGLKLPGGNLVTLGLRGDVGVGGSALELSLAADLHLTQKLSLYLEGAAMAASASGYPGVAIALSVGLVWDTPPLLGVDLPISGEVFPSDLGGLEPLP